MGWLRKLLGVPPRRTEYERGQEEAERFLATGPEADERRWHYHNAACLRDEYDRGYLHALIDHEDRDAKKA